MSYLILKIMKNLILFIACISLFSSLTSCTAEDLPSKNPVKNQTSVSGKDGDIDPPITTGNLPIPPKK